MKLIKITLVIATLIIGIHTNAIGQMYNAHQFDAWSKAMANRDGQGNSKKTANNVISKAPKIKGFYKGQRFEEACNNLENLTHRKVSYAENACIIKSYSHTYIMKNRNGTVNTLSLDEEAVDKIFDSKNVTFDDFVQQIKDTTNINFENKSGNRDTAEGPIFYRHYQAEETSRNTEWAMNIQDLAWGTKGIEKKFILITYGHPLRISEDLARVLLEKRPDLTIQLGI